MRQRKQHQLGNKQASAGTLGATAASKQHLHDLVRKEIKDVNRIRALVIALLVVAFTLSTLGAFHVAKTSNENMFRTEFNAMARSMLGTFLEETAQRMEVAQEQSIAIKAEYDRPNADAFVQLGNFYERTTSVRMYHLIDSIVWSPLLNTDEERQTFEDHSSSKNTTAIEDTSSYACNPCGEGNKIEFPSAYVTIPGYGDFICKDVDIFAKENGIRDATTCEVGSAYVREACGCIPDGTSIFDEDPSSESGYTCDACGEGYKIEFPDAWVTLPGYEPFTCNTVDHFGKESGMMNAVTCELNAPSVREQCGCIPDDAERFPDMLSTTTGLKSSLPSREVEDGIYRIENGTAVDEDEPGPYFPISQVVSIVGDAMTAAPMYNLYSSPTFRPALDDMMHFGATVSTEVYHAHDDTLNFGVADLPGRRQPSWYISFFVPVESDDHNVIGAVGVVFMLRSYIADRHLEGSANVVLVYDNYCGQSFTYRITDGNGVLFVGEGDLHDPKYDAWVHETEYSNFTAIQLLMSKQSTRLENHTKDSPFGCPIRLRVYPSAALASTYDQNTPTILAICVVCLFAITATLFCIYDRYVSRLQRKVMDNAAHASSIVENLFPSTVRDRLFGNGYRQEKMIEQHHQAGILPLLLHPKMKIQNLLDSGSLVSMTENNDYSDEPIADLFLNTTVLFADIQGFTAWSSEREPAQVFKLLESVYQCFDDIADRLGVFKVETIGDCYVAVCGLPEPRSDHAVIMAEFAAECIKEMKELTLMLEASLGPSTSDLGMRFGLHSGPVVAGVLRGQKARFQLFGDTINTAARMESTGTQNRIHASLETVDLLHACGKGTWVVKRQGKVFAKGKGEMETYWIIPSPVSIPNAIECAANPSLKGHPLLLASPRDQLSSHRTLSVSFGDSSIVSLPNYEQLIDWNTDLLLQHLTKVVERRLAGPPGPPKNVHDAPPGHKCFVGKEYVVDEVTEIMHMPRHDNWTPVHHATPIEISPAIRSQLRSYVSRIASKYRNVPFHNFEHASHVALSANKLIQRIIVPEGVNYSDHMPMGMNCAQETAERVQQEIHGSTFGISSDPLMQFVIIFATLIHDVDHTGVANKQLVLQQTELAVKFMGKCVAEQHSVVLAWQILMEDEFEGLRECIYGQSTEESARFRQLLVNAVIATDIADKELGALRKNRWTKAFHGEETAATYDDIDRKATIVFEHIIQASDVAHTMQHWQVFEKWNARLFDEMYGAFMSGQSNEDPSQGWYESEIGFFDYYIIPLARKLEECGVFGVSSDEYLLYALANRQEWEKKGKAIVNQYMSRQREKYQGRDQRSDPKGKYLGRQSIDPEAKHRSKQMSFTDHQESKRRSTQTLRLDPMAKHRSKQTSKRRTSKRSVGRAMRRQSKTCTIDTNF